MPSWTRIKRLLIGSTSAFPRYYVHQRCTRQLQGQCSNVSQTAVTVMLVSRHTVADTPLQHSRMKINVAHLFFGNAAEHLAMYNYKALRISGRRRSCTCSHVPFRLPTGYSPTPQTVQIIWSPPSMIYRWYDGCSVACVFIRVALPLLWVTPGSAFLVPCHFYSCSRDGVKNQLIMDSFSNIPRVCLFAVPQIITNIHWYFD
ncbi:hypothetical protein F4604DRAFT_1291818 [Suillus subluteus]|nr:hypothetical protein F4604DRAFT_1291818 [Suillus subluteus]